MALLDVHGGPQSTHFAVFGKLWILNSLSGPGLVQFFLASRLVESNRLSLGGSQVAPLETL